MNHFSRREQELLVYFCLGMSQKDVAKHTRLSVNTVKDYCKTINRKLGVHSLREIQAGIIASLAGQDVAASIRSALTDPRFIQRLQDCARAASGQLQMAAAAAATGSAVTRYFTR